MTTPANEPPPSAHALDDSASAEPDATFPYRRSHVELSAVQAVGELCPYLTAASGSWRSSAANREHRCGALDPPGQLPLEKQRRLCLSTHHVSCPAFRAARAGRAAVLAPGLDPTAVAVVDAARRPLARTSAIVLQQPRFMAPVARWPLDRALSQAALVALLVLAFAVVAVARLTSSDGGAAIGSPSASPTASAPATPRPTRRPTPSPSGSGSLVPSGSPAPSFRATYRVQAGDTLVEIAAQFDTTVAAIQEANGLTGSDLRIGQILNIP